MIKRRLIIPVLIIGLALTGTGYAYWTDQLKISSTVSTGELRVEFVEEEGWVPSIYPAITEYEPYLQLGKAHGNKATSFTIGNMFPGATVVYEANMANLGTIPAKIENIEISFPETEDSQEPNDPMDLVKSNLEVSGYFDNGVEYTTFGYEGDEDYPLKLKDLQGRLNILLAGSEIDVKNFANIGLNFCLPSDVDNELEDQNINFNIKFNYEQFNQ